MWQAGWENRAGYNNLYVVGIIFVCLCFMKKLYLRWKLIGNHSAFWLDFLQTKKIISLDLALLDMKIYFNYLLRYGQG